MAGHESGQTVVAWIVAGGGGTIIGGVITAIVQTWGSQGKDRAAAADTSVGVADRMLKRLEADNARLRDAMVELTDALDEVLSDLPAKDQARLREANSKAKRAT